MKNVILLILFSSSFAVGSDKYWVGGSGNWNDPSHWSAISGGTGGQYPPTSGDEAWFDANSFTTHSAINLDHISAFKDLHIQDLKGSLTFRGSDLSIAGSVYINSLVNFNGPAIVLAGTGILSASKQLDCDVTINTEGKYIFHNNLRFAQNSTVTLLRGYLEIKSEQITFGTFETKGRQHRTIRCNDGNIMIQRGWKISSEENLNFHSEKSKIRITKFVDPDSIQKGTIPYHSFLTSRDNICPPLTLQTGMVQSTCNGDNEGIAWVNVSGCSGTHTTSWYGFPGVTSDSLYNLPPGTFTVDILCSDGSQCYDDIVVTEPSKVRFNTLSVTSNCYPTCSSYASANVGGGVPPRVLTWYSYPSMTLLGTGSTVNNLCAGNTYLARVTDSRGCISDSTFTIPNSINLTPTIMYDFCTDSCSAMIFVSASGGSTPYTYSWSNGDQTYYVNNLCQGTYTLSVTDNQNCLNVLSVPIPAQPAQLGLTFTKYPPLCYGGTGSAVAIPSGGVPPYIYSWNTGSNTDTTGGLSAGIHSVTIWDSLGCSHIDTVSINQPSQINIIFEKIAPLCLGDSNGVAVASVSGGTFPYTYSWNNGSFNDTISGIPTGIYSLTISDYHSCQASDTVHISPSQFIPLTDWTNDTLYVVGNFVSHQWFMNGDSILNATGSWYYPQISGDYQVKVTDSTGCSGMSNNRTILITSLSVTDNQETKIFPNPAADHFYILTNSKDVLFLEVKDIQGRIVKEIAIPNSGKHFINSSDLVPGVYCIFSRSEQIFNKLLFIVR